ncbi:hypothetical protein IPF86_01050 [Candidatus Nomurabacteria bacterium]|nr:MAG: hypothetical protein IPF86_01050 [Candidatus Nomurabacteria bacterium]
MKIKILLLHATSKIEPWFQDKINELKEYILQQEKYEFVAMPEMFDHEKFIEVKLGLIEKADIVVSIMTVPSNEVGMLTMHAASQKYVLAISEAGYGERSVFVRTYKRKRHNYTFVSYTNVSHIIEELNKIWEKYFAEKEVPIPEGFTK